VLTALIKRLKRGASLTVIGYAHDNVALAKKGATVVADFFESRAGGRVTVKVVLTSLVGKVMVITTKQ
jgi:hypothetical protein